MYSIDTSRAVFFTNLSTICLANSSVIAFLFSEACASKVFSAPSISRMFVLMEYARYSTTSFGSSIPLPCIFLCKTAILVSKSGTDKSAERPHLKRDNKRCSIPCNSTGALSEVKTICFPF